MAEVRLTSDAVEQLEVLSNPLHARILKLLARLEDWPRVSGAKPLRGDLTGHFRLRTGDYRLQLQVVGDVVFVEKIGHRDKFYEE